MSLKRSVVWLAIALASVVVLSCSPLIGNSSSPSPTAVTTSPTNAGSPKADPGFQLLFNGVSTANWRMSTVKNPPGANPGHFVVVNDMLEAVAGNTLGMYWCTTPTPPDFLLKVEWMTSRISDNSGVFVRFPNPEKTGYDSTALTGNVDGFEVQIDQLGRPDGASQHKTGAIYGLAGPVHANNLPAHPPGQWNLFEIRVQGQTYTISLNGVQITVFHFVVGSDRQHPDQGLPSTPTVPRFIGLQVHPGSAPIYFRNIQIKALS